MATVASTKPKTRKGAAQVEVEETEQATPQQVVDLSGDRTHEEEAADIIRLQYTGLRYSISRGPRSRKVSDAKNREAAEAVGADPETTTLIKRLFDVKQEPAIQYVNSVCGDIGRVVRDRLYTLPTPQPATRLVRRNKLVELNTKLTELSALLQRRAVALEAELPGIIAREQARSPGLFSVEVYSAFVPSRDISVSWSFPPVMEDRELAQLDNNVYQQELNRVREELKLCIRKCEDEMTESLYEALTQAASSLTDVNTGKKKTFKATTVTKLYDELSNMSLQLTENKIGGQAMKDLADRLQGVLGASDKDLLPAALRSSEKYRERFAAQCQEVAGRLLETASPERRRRLIIRED